MVVDSSGVDVVSMVYESVADGRASVVVGSAVIVVAVCSITVLDS